MVLAGISLYRSVRALDHVRTDASMLSQRMARGDFSGAREVAASLTRDSQIAHRATTGLVWTAASHLPFVGDNFTAGALAARVADVVGQETAPAFLSLATAVQTGDLKPVGGRVDPAAIAAHAPAVDAAAKAFDAPAAELLNYHSDSLLPAVARAVRSLQQQVGDARSALHSAATALRVLPGMLGSSGPRDYLMVVQNPAEIRASGGLPGTWVLLHADNGRVSIGGVYGASALGKTDAVVTQTADEQSLFGLGFGKDIGDLTVTPDFPRVAQIAAAKLQQAKGISVAGVFSIDPIALADVLRGTGPVSVAEPGPVSVLHGAMLTSVNAAQVLMNQVYFATSDYGAQQAFFGAAAMSSFEALIRGQGNQVLALQGLVKAAQEHRVLLWSSDPVVTAAIAQSGLSGALVADDGATPHVGIYLNDAVAGKPEFYLRHSISARALSCDGASQTLQVSATFRSVMPAGAAQFPLFVVGSGAYAPPGVIAMSVDVIAPWRGQLVSLEINGRAAAVGGGQLNGRPVWAVPVVLHPGESVTLTATMRTGVNQTGDGRLTWTPGMEQITDPATFRSACTVD